MDFKKYDIQMEKIIKHLEQEFSQLQIWRASTWLLESVEVFIPTWGMKQKINQLANIWIMDAQTIKIEPWDKSILSHIEKWIYDAWLWLTPINQWHNLLIQVPPLTQERRKELAKLVNKMWEDAKVAVRNCRHDAIKEIKKSFEDKSISEDEKKNNESEIDELTKKHTTKIESETKNKSNEIMTI